MKILQPLSHIENVGFPAVTLTASCEAFDRFLQSGLNFSEE